MTTNLGPRTPAADALHQMKYRGQGEDFRESMNRLAFGLKDGDAHYHELREIFLNQRFLPAGRVQSAIGASRQTTAMNCYVAPTIADSFVEGPNSIMDVAKMAAATMRMGGGIGYDFSTLRPQGDIIAKLQSHASGPPSFMRIFNEICLATSSSGHRRGAQMGILRIDHPDIETFIHAKQNDSALRGFNISVAVTSEFMEAALTGKEFDLRWNGRIYRTIDAAQLWEKIMRSTWDWAEPGVFFIDTVNSMNNLWYCETIAATNPCGEQPLPPHGSCLLGSFNLVKYLVPVGGVVDASAARYSFNYDQLKADLPAIVRGMDNVTDRTRYPLAEQRAEAATKRRMGLGITGLANAAEACGFPYGSKEFLHFEAFVLETIRNGAYAASVELAREKGPFPLFDAERYLRGRFIKCLPEEIQRGIARYGIRNSHLTSIAPTGTISMTSDNVSSGLEPVLYYATRRPINTPDGPIEMEIEDYGAKFLGVRGKLAEDTTAEEHTSVLITGQQYVDSAVSKTVNMDGSMPWSDFKMIYQRAWEGGAKGCATFNADGKRGALLTRAKPKESDEDGAACVYDPATGVRSCE